MKRVIPALVAGAALAGGALLAGCTTATPSLGQCAMTTNGGFGSNGQGVTSIVHPGGRVSVGNGEQAWYYPCNERNFVTAAHGGDRSAPEYAVRTAAGTDGTPGMPVYVWSSVYFTPNQADAVMPRFLAFCLKYGCATNDPQDDSSVSGSAHSSTPGWENMLLENMGPAVDRASQLAVQDYGPTLWRDQADWTKLGDAIAANLNAQLAKETGTAVPYFCGPSSTQTDCTGMSVIVSNVTPADPAVVTLYNQQVAAEQSKVSNAARLAAAQALYGPYAQYFLGLDDLANQCSDSGKCVLYVGAPNSVPASGTNQQVSK